MLPRGDAAAAVSGATSDGTVGRGSSSRQLQRGFAQRGQGAAGPAQPWSTDTELGLRRVRSSFANRDSRVELSAFSGHRRSLCPSLGGLRAGGHDRRPRRRWSSVSSRAASVDRRRRPRRFLATIGRTGPHSGRCPPVTTPTRGAAPDRLDGGGLRRGATGRCACDPEQRPSELRHVELPGHPRDRGEGR